MAWLNARPREDGKKSLASKPNDEPLTRLEQLEADHIDPSYPPISIPEIVQWLMELGPVEPAGMGAAAISWRTIDAWCIRTGVDLSPWQAKLLRRLSGDWLTEGDRARKPDCPPPWSDPRLVDRVAVGKKIELAFAALALRLG